MFEPKFKEENEEKRKNRNRNEKKASVFKTGSVHPNTLYSYVRK